MDALNYDQFAKRVRTYSDWWIVALYVDFDMCLVKDSRALEILDAELKRRGLPERTHVDYDPKEVAYA